MFRESDTQLGYLNLKLMWRWDWPLATWQELQDHGMVVLVVRGNRRKRRRPGWRQIHHGRNHRQVAGGSHLMKNRTCQVWILAGWNFINPRLTLDNQGYIPDSKTLCHHASYDLFPTGIDIALNHLAAWIIFMLQKSTNDVIGLTVFHFNLWWV